MQVQKCHSDKNGSKPSEDNPFNLYYHVYESKSLFYCHEKVKTGQTFDVNQKPQQRFVKRRPNVLWLFWPSFDVSSLESREDYYRRLIMLFKPWRKEENIKIDFKTNEEAWVNFNKNLINIAPEAFMDV